MEITQVRVNQIAQAIIQIRVILSTITEEELTELLAIGSREEAIGPLLDPTRWRDEDLFTKNNRALEVLRAIRELKRRLEHEAEKT